MTDMKTVKVERRQVRCNKDRVSSTEGTIEDLFRGLIPLMTTQKSNDYALDKKNQHCFLSTTYSFPQSVLT